MSYAFTFDTARKLIRVVQSEPETAYSALEMMREVRTHAAYRAEYRILCDFRRGEFPSGRVGLYQMIVVIKVFFRGQRMALVCSHPEHQESGHLVAEAASDDGSIRVFNSVEDAEAWLDSETTS